MKRKQLFERATKTLRNPFFIGLLVALLLVAAAAPPAQVQVARPWTAVASTGAIDESSLADFMAGSPNPATPSALGFKNNSQAFTLEARYNVTNTFDNNANPNIPGWTTLELVGEAPQGSTITASLFRIERCTGRILPPTPNQPNAPLCSVVISNQAASVCRTCNFAAALVDFSQFFYFVDVKFTRPNVQARPQAFAMRVL
jgi:hypothetical protein